MGSVICFLHHGVSQSHVDFERFEATMVTPFNPALYDGEGNLIVPRHGIRIALGVALLGAVAFFLITFFEDRKWHVDHPGSGASGFPEPLWMSMLWVALPLVPFVLSVLLLSARREDAIASGAGVAAALFFDSLIFAIAAAVGFMFFGPSYYGPQTAISILIFIACSLWIIVSAFRIGAKAGWGLFFLAAGVTLFCMAVAYHFLNQEDRELDRQNEWRKRQAAVEVLEVKRPSTSWSR